MSASLKSHSQGQTLVLTISNPEHHNALDATVCAAAVEALGVAESSEDIRSVVIAGEGLHFCAGLDLHALNEDRQLGATHNLQQIESHHNWIEAIRTFPKPVVAAVEGACAATGFSLALACDLLVAAHNSVFVMSHSTVGLSPDGGATQQLMAALPRAAATHLLMTGERMSADRLHQWGVVTQLSNPGEALSDALALCERLKVPNDCRELAIMAARDHGNIHRAAELRAKVAALTGAQTNYQANPRKEAIENDLIVDNSCFLELGLQPTTLDVGLLAEVVDVAVLYHHRLRFH
jgi:enoyl-CoA hydratase/carnithine racemase